VAHQKAGAREEGDGRANQPVRRVRGVETLQHGEDGAGGGGGSLLPLPSWPKVAAASGTMAAASLCRSNGARSGIPRSGFASAQLCAELRDLPGGTQTGLHGGCWGRAA
jgi:hypothetical protein